jgi:AcrR family transcriptional regulator
MSAPPPELGPTAPAPAEIPRRPTRRGRPPKRPSAIDTTATILDVAEDLFSKHGFHGVTLREVAREAGVDTALLHYYFDGKRGLFDAVFLRRAEVMNADRMAALDRYAAQSEGCQSGGGMTAEGLIDAFVGPALDWQATGGPGWKHYCALVAQVNAAPAWGAETMAHYFDPLVHRFIELMRQALPGAALHDLYWAYHNLSGALTLTMGETGRLDRLSQGLCRAGDIAAARRAMVAFAAAGFRAVCGRGVEGR